MVGFEIPQAGFQIDSSKVAPSANQTKAQKYRVIRGRALKTDLSVLNPNRHVAIHLICGLFVTIFGQQVAIRKPLLRKYFTKAFNCNSQRDRFQSEHI